jgi:hypothetical protein
MMLFKRKQFGLINQPDALIQTGAEGIAIGYSSALTQLIVSDIWLFCEHLLT